jgi:L-seryl-tRNA(Ser) seleniumtransferase
MRALRVDKMALAALEATLRLAMDPDHAAGRIPLWSMISAPLSDIQARADALAGRIRSEIGLDATMVSSEAFIGGGSVPIHPIPSAAVALRPPFPIPREEGSEAAWAEALRRSDPPVVGRVQGGLVLLDLRTVSRDQDPRLLDVIRGLCQDKGDPERARPGRDLPGHAGEAAGEADGTGRRKGQA